MTKNGDIKKCEISNLLESFGKYQVIQYALISLATVFVTMININYVFVAGDLHYRCRVEACEDAYSTVHPTWWPDAAIDRCSRPMLREDLDPGPCTNTSFTGLIDVCTDWVYESNNTIVGELDLGCQPLKTSLVGTIHCTGMLVSIVLSGWLSDRFGRKPALIFSAVAGCVGNIKTFVTSYYLYVSIEFLEGTFTGGLYSAALVLMLEIAGKKYRIASGVIFAFAIYSGEALFACIAMYVPYWKTLVHIINGPTILFLSYIFLIKESPRWQVVSGKVDEAKKAMKHIAETNRLNIDFKELSAMDGDELKYQFDIRNQEIKERFVDIFTSRAILERLLVASVARFTSSLVYSGLLINSVWLPGDKYTNFLLSTVMSFPGEFLSLYLMNRIGRKLPLITGYMCCGLTCLVSAYVPDSYTWTKIAAFLISKVIIAACFTGAVTYSMELFPTSARGSLVGFASFSSRLAGMLAPLTPVLNTISPGLPSILFGCFSILTGFLMMLTPETKDLPLMDTIIQVEASRRAQKDQKKSQSVDTLETTDDSV